MAANDGDRLARDLSSPEFAAYVAQGFWELAKREGHIVYVLMYAPDGRTFLARLDCSDYWTEPITGGFSDPADLMEKPAAWPDGNAHFEQWIKFKGTPWFICWDQDGRGIQHHQGWKARKAWQKKPNQLLAYLDFLRQMLHVPAFGYSRKNSQRSA
jgi:hypothetical protein